MQQSSDVALVEPLEKVRLRVGAEIEEVHDLGYHFPGRAAPQGPTMDAEELDRPGVMSVAPVEQRPERAAIGQYV